MPLVPIMGLTYPRSPLSLPLWGSTFNEEAHRATVIIRYLFIIL
jgi:hypothetical protein